MLGLFFPSTPSLFHIPVILPKPRYPSPSPLISHPAGKPGLGSPGLGSPALPAQRRGGSPGPRYPASTVHATLHHGLSTFGAQGKDLGSGLQLPSGPSTAGSMVLGAGGEACGKAAARPGTATLWSFTRKTGFAPVLGVTLWGAMHREQVGTRYTEPPHSSMQGGSRDPQKSG